MASTAALVSAASLAVLACGGSAETGPAPVTPSEIPQVPSHDASAAPSGDDAGGATSAPLASASSATTSPTGDAAHHDVDAGAHDAAATSSASVVAVTEADNGKTITAKKGQDVVISLPANPSTGYDWVVTRVSKTLGQPTMGSTSSAPGVPGAGGMRTLTFKITAGPLDTRGSHALVAEYKRSFEQGKPPQKTFKLTIKVTD